MHFLQGFSYKPAGASQSNALAAEWEDKEIKKGNIFRFLGQILGTAYVTLHKIPVSRNHPDPDPASQTQGQHAQGMQQNPQDV